MNDSIEVEDLKFCVKNISVGDWAIELWDDKDITFEKVSDGNIRFTMSSDVLDEIVRLSNMFVILRDAKMKRTIK